MIGGQEACAPLAPFCSPVPGPKQGANVSPVNISFISSAHPCVSAPAKDSHPDASDPKLNTPFTLESSFIYIISFLQITFLFGVLSQPWWWQFARLVLRPSTDGVLDFETNYHTTVFALLARDLVDITAYSFPPLPKHPRAGQNIQTSLSSPTPVVPGSSASTAAKVPQSWCPSFRPSPVLLVPPTTTPPAHFFY